jgi:ABC-type lipoprotein release transport system permease subunit
MLEPTIVIAAAALIGLTIVVLAMLRGWQDYLTLKRRELEGELSVEGRETGSRLGAARIEISDLKERIRKLEAIANGVDL